MRKRKGVDKLKKIIEDNDIKKNPIIFCFFFDKNNHFLTFKLFISINNKYNK